MIIAVRTKNVNRPFQKIIPAIINRVAVPERIVIQNILFARAWGRSLNKQKTISLLNGIADGFSCLWVHMPCLHSCICIDTSIACTVAKSIIFDKVSFFNNLDVAAFTIILHCFFYFGSIGAIRISLAFTISN